MLLIQVLQMLLYNLSFAPILKAKECSTSVIFWTRFDLDCFIKLSFEFCIISCHDLGIFILGHAVKIQPMKYLVLSQSSLPGHLGFRNNKIIDTFGHGAPSPGHFFISDKMVLKLTHLETQPKRSHRL